MVVRSFRSRASKPAGSTASRSRAATAIVERHAGALARFAVRLGVDEDVDELVQDTFIKAFQSIHRFQGQSSFFTWLYRIAVNSTFTHLRKARLRSFFSLERVDSDEPVAKEIIDALTDTSGADRESYVRELQEKLNDAMQKLSIKHRTVVTLFEIEGLGHQEIAEIMGCSVGTVRSRLHRGRKLMRKHLEGFSL